MVAHLGESWIKRDAQAKQGITSQEALIPAKNK
jgi:hypothetical protein